ncbi:MAG: hypothetical protein ACYTBJ_00100 [Planctomycetota bacterium]
MSAAGTAVPTERTRGVDVSKWRRVLFSVHPTNPELDGAVAGWQVEVKVWRWKQKATRGTGRSGGQWYAEQQLTVSMDGDVANGGPMEYELPTLDSEKMYFQVVASLQAPDSWELMISTYGLVPRVTEDGASCECESAGAATPGAGGGSLVVANMFDLIAHEDNTYSTLRGDFNVTRVSNTTFDISDLDFAIVEEQILAIGLKETGSANQMRIWYRDKDLRCFYTTATGRVTVAGFTIGASDSISVWIEGPSKTADPTNRARRIKNINPDSYHVIRDGPFLSNMTIAEGASDDYFPFMMGQDGYHWISCAFTITVDAYVRLEATNDLERDGGEAWYDVTEEVLGVSQVDSTNAGRSFPPQCWVGWARMRWVVGEDGSGGTVVLYFFRSAYGDNWVPVARESEPVITGGYQMMGEARSSQAAAITQGDAGRLVTNLYKELVLANHIWATQANRTEEDDPLDTRDIPDTLNLENITAASHDYYFDMAHFKFISIQLDFSAALGVGVTVWASNQDDGTAPNACFYTDVTNAWFGAGSFNSDAYLEDGNNVKQTKYVRIRVDNTGGAATEDLDIYVRRCW